ncbi:MAG TPA: hypothetical protein VFR95_08660 [Gemmatimonadaceae bacterium]|nr:hypothetical protein [Gemmatimonadaceae bacterium]
MSEEHPRVPAARLTPYELILEPLESSIFPAIRAEAEQRGKDARRRDQFLLLGTVAAALGEMMADDAPSEAVDEYGELLYQGFQFWAFGRRTYFFGDDVAELLSVPEYAMDSWILAAPPACYLQFPYQRFWARVGADEPFEPADGCFVVVDDTAPAPQAGAHLRVQLVLGVRTDRPGVSLMSYRTDLDPYSVSRLARTAWREGSAPFSNAIPGGERKGYHTLATTSELEALVLRALHYLDTNPRALIPHPGSSIEGESRLPWIEVKAG